MRRFFAIFKDAHGATSVEYGMILALIFLAMIGALGQFGTTAINMWNMVANEIGGS
ncbi:Flp family type IVb pilin [Sphingosinicella sp. CPCC 101087]|uniref:Flp family type IVb pilin n=1 Tax=Sphingosinicella sp. CPCC 101087 TaxID=2497754 RepID=UPI00101CEF9B|nr:Flp family type IVb pilin [Sphingosinicella sp. CPCC 101087]